jgi:hypothetical protein
LIVVIVELEMWWLGKFDCRMVVNGAWWLRVCGFVVAEDVEVVIADGRECNCVARAVRRW